MDSLHQLYIKVNDTPEENTVFPFFKSKFDFRHTQWSRKVRQQHSFYIIYLAFSITFFCYKMSSSAGVDIHTARFNSLAPPLAVYGILSAYACATYLMKTEWSWFSWHPFCMIIGFVVLAGNAILLKKIGKYGIVVDDLS